MTKIFISYRRDDSRKDAGRIHDKLEQVFGERNVFKDVSDIRAGTDFRRAIFEEIINADVVLVIIGKYWLTITDENGNRRLDNSADFVRIEVETALTGGKTTVIPILVDNAKMPKPDELPVSMRELAFKHAIAIRDDPDFNRDLNQLIEDLKFSVKKTSFGKKTTLIPASKLQTKRRTPSLLLGGLILLVIVAAAIFLSGILNNNDDNLTAREESTEVAQSTPTSTLTPMSTRTARPTSTLTTTPTLTNTKSSTLIITATRINEQTAITIGDIITASTEDENGQFNSLFAAIQAANPALLEVLYSLNGEYTFFAPIDSAFANFQESIGVDAFDSLSTNPEQISNLLFYHLVDGYYTSADLSQLDGESLTTLQGNKLVVRVEAEAIYVGETKVTATDVEASNGVIHVINQVLIPPIEQNG